MLEIDSDVHKEKTKEEYSRNVKKLKVKLTNVQSEIASIEKKVSTLQNTSNDKIIALKIAKFCKERSTQLATQISPRKCCSGSPTRSVTKQCRRSTSKKHLSS